VGRVLIAFVKLGCLLADLRPCREFRYNPDDETSLIKELTLQVRKVIAPFAAPKKVFIVGDLPKTRSGKVRPFPQLFGFFSIYLHIMQIMRRILRKIVAGEGDQLGDLSTLAEPAVVDVIKERVAKS